MLKTMASFHSSHQRSWHLEKQLQFNNFFYLSVCIYVWIYFASMKNSCNVSKNNRSVTEYVLRYLAKIKEISDKQKTNLLTIVFLQKFCFFSNHAWKNCGWTYFCIWAWLIPDPWTEKRHTFPIFFHFFLLS